MQLPPETKRLAASSVTALIIAAAACTSQGAQGGAGAGAVAGWGGDAGFGGSVGPSVFGGNGGNAGMPSSGMGADNGGSNTGSFNSFPCVASDAGSGFVSCDNLLVHRATKEQCPSFVPRESNSQDGGAGDDANSTDDGAASNTPCSHDADCTAEAHGHCDSSGACRYGCVRDEECATGQICLCGYPVGQCVNATCSVDSDCAPGFNCASYAVVPGCGEIAFACQAPGDGCASDIHCTLPSHCIYQAGRRICSVPAESRDACGP
jgi:hypothetical protein